MAEDVFAGVGRGRSLPINTAWAVAGNGFYAGGRFVAFVLLTQLLSTEQVGQFVLALAIVTPLSFLVNMELRLVLVTDTQGRVDAGHCLTTRLMSNVVLVGCLGGLCWALHEAAPRQWGWDMSVVLLWAGAVRMVESWADVYLAVLQKHERMKHVAISQGLKTGLLLVWVLLAGKVRGDIVWVLQGWVGIIVLVGWYYDHRQAARYASVRPKWSGRASEQLLRWGFPLGVFVAITSVNASVAQYFIKFSWGDTVVAYYGALVFVVGGLASVQNGVNQSVVPRLARYWAESGRDFWRLLAKVVGWSWVVLAGVLVLVWWQGELILGLFYPAEYAEQGRVFAVVMLGGCFLLTGMTLGDAVVACQRFKSRAMAVGLGMTVNVALCWLYVDEHGLAGAAWAAVVSSGVTMLACGGVLAVAGWQRRV